MKTHKIKHLLMLVLAIGVIGFTAGCQASTNNNESAANDPISQAQDPFSEDESTSESMDTDLESIDDDNQSSGNGLEDINGSYDGSIYHNAYYGFSMVIPDNWYDQDTGEALSPTQYVGFPITLGYAEDPSDMLSYLGNFFDFSISSPVDGVDDQAMIEQLMATYKQMTYDALIEQGLDDSMTKEYEENDTTFGDGLKGKVATVTTTSEYGTNYVTIYLIALPSHDIINVSAVYDNPAAAESVMTMLNSISVDE